MESVTNTVPPLALQVRPKSPDPERDSKIQPIVPSDETQKPRKQDTSDEDQTSHGKFEIDIDKLREAAEQLYTNDTTRLTRS